MTDPTHAQRIAELLAWQAAEQEAAAARIAERMGLRPPTLQPADGRVCALDHEAGKASSGSPSA